MTESKKIVYVIQELPGTKVGVPKINIMSARKHGEFKFLLPEFSQIIFSPGPLIFKLRNLLKDYTPEDYLLLTGDPAIIGVACSIVSDMTNGRYNLLKWDKQIECIIRFQLTYTRKEKYKMSNINFEADQREDLDSVNEAGSLAEQVVKLQKLEEELLVKEAEAKELKRKVDLVSSEVIPTMMQEMNISTLKLADGTSVEVKPVYGASIPADKKEDAYTWLRENGLGDLIKNEVTVAFGRSEDNKAQQYAVLAQGQGYEPVQKLKVEPMTLKALVRERIENGLDMPSDLFNLFTSNRTKITRNK